jgi:hypothetical protein
VAAPEDVPPELLPYFEPADWPVPDHMPFPTGNFAGAHYASFSPDLPAWCIKASVPQYCCPNCGAGYARVIERSVRFEGGSGRAGNVPDGKWAGTEQATSGTYDIRMGPVVTNRTLGWRPTCACKNAGPPVPGTVLDPFFGAGSTAIASERLGRNCIGIDLNGDYSRMSVERITNDAPLLTTVTYAAPPTETADSESESDGRTKQERYPDRRVAGFNQRWKASREAEEGRQLALFPAGGAEG